MAVSPLTKVPIPTLERLATYLRLLSELESRGVTTVSSHDVERYTGIGAPQFRKDLSYFGEFGRPGVGYNVVTLQRTIAGILKIDRTQPVILIGAGNLGRALVGYPGLADNNLDICGVFDNSVAKIGTRLWGLEIRDVRNLAEANRTLGARIAVIAVPAAAAQGVADACVGAGIEVILNFSPTHIRVPGATHIRHVSFLQELAVLAYHLPDGTETKGS
jgi:redox-sensing transcriptional repressor